MNPSAPIWFVYALWLLLIVYLSVSAIGAKPDTERHLVQSFGLLFAMIAAFLLPRLSLFSFVNFAPVGPVSALPWRSSAQLSLSGLANVSVPIGVRLSRPSKCTNS